MNKTEMMRQLGAGIAMSVRKAALTDAEALQVKGLHEEWTPGQAVKTGDRRQYNGRLYRCRQDHTTQADWTPDVFAAGWTVINETNAGTVDDPVPWVTGMQPEAGKYYVEGNLLALCIEDPGQAIYGTLSALCPGRYFEAYTA
ncbi:carbohydrate binding domain protein [Marvinbryantia formatexigens DSM 14469]|uniref:Carbohydrate binding domain protein n=1 Tax=Marvinbryantia formatexigens DSM 14469 TaxID=478749 RepID=C6LG78_9FIRM|nr:carbohydrate-binding protein [Marvinbryantia formatexigens]EET60442.1 carbohydrate binding domain protein [Marvinbryantia formatexigens DSM 14469]UWO25219.1 hypothetical protein NQ534_01645 [Marvinbryantia formatexigens DSM 14469]SDH05580.1 hypothetical protein SAMN05660368_03769 [Marvinbryantia formatexigens]